MAFDANLDKNLFSESIEWDTTRITVGVFSYNDGPTKLQISRENRNPNSLNPEFKWSKLGRMTKGEAEKVIPLIEKVLPSMKEEEEDETEEDSGKEEKTE